MSSACASVAVTAKPITKQTTFITTLPFAYKAAPSVVGSFRFRRGRSFRTVADNQEDRFLVLGPVEVNLLAVMRDECPGGHRDRTVGVEFVPLPTHHVPFNTVINRSCG